MREYFKVFAQKAWEVTDDALIYANKTIPYSELSEVKFVRPPTPAQYGQITAILKGETLEMFFKMADKKRGNNAFLFMEQKFNETHGIVPDYKFKLRAYSTGTTLKVYDTYLLLDFIPLDRFRSGTGEKRLNYTDLTAVQFKEPIGTDSIDMGFIQFAYPGSLESKGNGRLDGILSDENTVPVEMENVTLAREIVAYIEQQRNELKASSATTVVQQSLSAADELKKFKELLDMGVITQEEFDAKKKQLLGL